MPDEEKPSVEMSTEEPKTDESPVGDPSPINQDHHSVTYSHGVKRSVFIGLVAMLVAIAGTATFVFLGSDANDDYSAETTTAANQTSAPAPVEEEEAVATLVSEYLGNYTLEEDAYGTEVSVVVDEEGNTRTITANALPNHETGDFPNDGNPNTISAQSASYTYPFDPSFTGSATEVRTPGVAINGVKFEPGTAETFSCSSGETYRVEAIQDLTSLGLDFNNAHVQPTGEYHYHGISQMMAEIFDAGQDLVHIGFAADGFLMYYSKSGAYSSSYKLGTGERSGSGCTYSISSQDVDFSSTKDGAVTSDWEYDERNGDLDECNGTTIDGQYVYIVTDEFPFISRCLMGDVNEAEAGGAGGGGSGGAPPNGESAPTEGPGLPPPPSPSNLQ